MKPHTRFTTILFLGLGLFYGLFACQSDTGRAAQEASASAMAQDDLAGAQQSPANDTKAVVERYTSRVQELEKSYADFCKNIIALQQEVKGLPASYKHQASDFAELEARLEKYPEKGAVMQDEAKQIHEELRATMGSDLAQSAGLGDKAIIGEPLLKRIKELEISEPGYTEAYRQLKQAVDRLKQAKGTAITLF